MTGLRRAIPFAIGVVLLASCAPDAPEQTLSGYQLDPAASVGDLSLPDASAGGNEFTFKAKDNHLLIVYFGYTACPDVCPTTLTDVRNALRQIGDSAEQVDLAMVTVDPNRDTDEVLTGYVQSFLTSAHALRTEDADTLQAVASAFGASYSVTTAADGTIEVSHSAATYLVDSDGAVVLVWPFGVPADGIATDLQILLRESTT